MTIGGSVIGAYVLIFAGIMYYTRNEDYATLGQRRHGSPLPTTRAVVFWLAYVGTLLSATAGIVIGGIFATKTDLRTHDQLAIRNLAIITAACIALTAMTDFASTHEHFRGNKMHPSVCGGGAAKAEMKGRT